MKRVKKENRSFSFFLVKWVVKILLFGFLLFYFLVFYFLVFYFLVLGEREGEEEREGERREERKEEILSIKKVTGRGNLFLILLVQN